MKASEEASVAINKAIAAQYSNYMHVENLAQFVSAICTHEHQHMSRTLPKSHKASNFQSAGVSGVPSFLGQLNGWHAEVVQNEDFGHVNKSANISAVDAQMTFRIQSGPCEICTESVDENKASTYLTRCGHTFCNRCLTHYLLLAARNSRTRIFTCPVTLNNYYIYLLLHFSNAIIFNINSYSRRLFT